MLYKNGERVSLADGKPCPRCTTPLVRKERPSDKPIGPNQTYYFRYSFWCVSCSKVWLAEEAKVCVIEQDRDEPQVADIDSRQTGKPCPRCTTPLVRKERPSDKPIGPNQKFYFRYWFWCVSCRNIRHVEEAKVCVIARDRDEPQVADIDSRQTGKPCPRCTTPLVRKERPSDKPIGPNQKFYFRYWFWCVSCRNIRHVEEAKVCVIARDRDVPQVADIDSRQTNSGTHHKSAPSCAGRAVES